MKKLQPFTLRLPMDSLTAIRWLVGRLAAHPLGVAMGKLNRQTVGRLVVERGIRALEDELNGEHDELEVAAAGLDSLAATLERVQDLARPLTRQLARLESVADVLERVAECGKAVDIIEQLESGADVLERIACSNEAIDALELLSAWQKAQKYTGVHSESEQSRS